MSAREEHPARAWYRAHVDAYNAGDVDAYVGGYAEAFCFHNASGFTPEELREKRAKSMKNGNDLTVFDLEVLSASDDAVVLWERGAVGAKPRPRMHHRLLRLEPTEGGGGWHITAEVSPARHGCADAWVNLLDRALLEQIRGLQERDKEEGRPTALPMELDAMRTEVWSSANILKMTPEMLQGASLLDAHPAMQKTALLAFLSRQFTGVEVEYVSVEDSVRFVGDPAFSGVMLVHVSVDEDALAFLIVEGRERALMAVQVPRYEPDDWSGTSVSCDGDDFLANAAIKRWDNRSVLVVESHADAHCEEYSMSHSEWEECVDEIAASLGRDPTPEESDECSVETTETRLELGAAFVFAAEGAAPASLVGSFTTERPGFDASVELSRDAMILRSKDATQTWPYAAPEALQATPESLIADVFHDVALRERAPLTGVYEELTRDAAQSTLDELSKARSCRENAMCPRGKVLASLALDSEVSWGASVVEDSAGGRTLAVMDGEVLATLPLPRPVDQLSESFANKGVSCSTQTRLSPGRSERSDAWAVRYTLTQWCSTWFSSREWCKARGVEDVEACIADLEISREVDRTWSFELLIEREGGALLGALPLIDEGGADESPSCHVTWTESGARLTSDGVSSTRALAYPDDTVKPLPNTVELGYGSKPTSTVPCARD